MVPSTVINKSSPGNDDNDKGDDMLLIFINAHAEIRVMLNKRTIRINRIRNFILIFLLNLSF